MEPFSTQTKSCLFPTSPFPYPTYFTMPQPTFTTLPCDATYAIHTTNSNHDMAKCLTMPSTCKTAMPHHLHCQPCHAINKIATLHPFILTAMPCHSRFHAMPYLPNTICHVVLTGKRVPLPKQLDAITLSPAHDHDRRRARMAGHSSPTKWPHVQSLSRSRLRS